MQQEKLNASPLIVKTPRGQGLLWRWWHQQIGVVLIKPATSENGMALDEQVTFLEPEEQAQVTVDLTQCVLNPPRWG